MSTRPNELDKIQSLFPEVSLCEFDLLKKNGGTICNRIFPYNENIVALPLINTKDEYTTPLSSFGLEKYTELRLWSSEYALYQSWQRIVDQLWNKARDRGFWTSRLTKVTERLCRHFKHYLLMDGSKVSPIDASRISLMLRLRNKLGLSTIDPKSLTTKDVNNSLYLLLYPKSTFISSVMGFPGAVNFLKKHLNETSLLDNELVNLLFTTAFPELIFPIGYVRRGVVIQEDQTLRLWIIGAALIVFLLSFFKVDLNLTAMQNYYRRQLEEGFLRLPTDKKACEKYGEGIAVHKDDEGAELFNRQLDMLKSTEIGFPYPLLHGYISHFERGREPNAQKKQFLFSPLFCGSEMLGYAPTQDYQNRFPVNIHENDLSPRVMNKLSLADAMSISGAAVTPYQTEGNYLLFSLMTILNFRLGQWLPNPGFGKGVLTPFPKNVLKSYVNDKMIWRRRDSNKCKMVFVADGGYVENLGVKALLDRQCRLIVGLDAGADPQGEFDNLVNLLRRAKEDGIKITLNMDLTELAADNADWFALIKKRLKTEAEQPYEFLGDDEFCFDPVLPARLLEEEYGALPPPFARSVQANESANSGSSVERSEVRDGTMSGSSSSSDAKEWKQFSSSHFLFFNIDYTPLEIESCNKREGLFVYVRSSLTGDEPPRLLLALRNSPPFPNHPTSEQLYDPDLVELYRELGLHLAEKLCLVMDELFTVWVVKDKPVEGKTVEGIDEVKQPSMTVVDWEHRDADLFYRDKCTNLSKFLYTLSCRWRDRRDVYPKIQEMVTEKQEKLSDTISGKSPRWNQPKGLKRKGKQGRN
ncbi:MAG: hypothetical protein U0796_21555 [Gemmatales bacterium]